MVRARLWGGPRPAGLVPDSSSPGWDAYKADAAAQGATPEQLYQGWGAQTASQPASDGNAWNWNQFAANLLQAGVQLAGSAIQGAQQPTTYQPPPGGYGPMTGGPSVVDWSQQQQPLQSFTGPVPPAPSQADQGSSATKTALVVGGIGAGGAVLAAAVSSGGRRR